MPELGTELAQLHAEIRACTRCGLSQTRTQAVPGVGPVPAEIMIVGEAPGFNEDRQGEPFVGPAGQLLDTLLGHIGLTRRQVYISNVLKCRPPQNRDPMPHEAEACAPFLDRQLKLIQPKVVLILGRHALERLLPGVGGISRIHGQILERGGITYMPLYHPAAALHNRSLIGDLQRDFDGVKRYLDSMKAQPPTNVTVEAGLASSSPSEPRRAEEAPEQLSLL